MKYRRKSIEVEAITFDELVKIGLREGGANIGPTEMPWSILYCGNKLVYHAPECYLVPTIEGTMKFYKEDMLITYNGDELFPCHIDVFEATYERVR